MDDTIPMVRLDPENSSSKPTPAKPRGSYIDHLANERTFLAWTRTSIGLFAAGCAIAHFGQSSNSSATSAGSFNQKKVMIAGLLLAIYAILELVSGMYRFYRVNRQISRQDFTVTSRIHEPIIATSILLLCMIAISIIFIIL
jgi:putative membrane protein